jgi:dehydratase
MAMTVTAMSGFGLIRRWRRPNNLGSTVRQVEGIMKVRALFAAGLTTSALVGLVACAPPPPPPTTTTTTTTTTTLPPTQTTVDFACTTDAFLLDFSAQALATIPQFAPYQVALSVAPVQIPSTFGSIPLSSFQNLRLRIAVPDGAVLAAAPVLTGGSNLGSGVPTASVLPTGAIELVVPGPLTPGSTVTIPTVTLPFLAVGSPGTVLDLQLAGSSTSDPPLTFTIGVEVAPSVIVPITQNCVESAVDPSVLSSTTVTGLLPPQQP